MIVVPSFGELTHTTVIRPIMMCMLTNEYWIYMIFIFNILVAKKSNKCAAMTLQA